MQVVHASVDALLHSVWHELLMQLVRGMTTALADGQLSTMHVCSQSEAPPPIPPTPPLVILPHACRHDSVEPHVAAPLPNMSAFSAQKSTMGFISG